MVDTRALRALVRKGVGVRLSPAAQPGPIGKWHTVSMGRTERERGRPAASGSETAVVELHWAVSSVGRVLRWHRRGHQSESGTVHQINGVNMEELSRGEKRPQTKSIKHQIREAKFER